MSKEQLLQYNIGYDQHETDTQFISTQIETHLRERFNVLVSTVEYEIADGHLIRRGAGEPFIHSIKRGRDLLQRIDPNAVDVEREDAEVEGFESVIDPYLSDPSRLLGSKILSISLQGDEGSKYQHNFYDIFTLKAKNGKRYVELSRYSSALEAKDYAQRLPGFDTENPPSDVQFLSNPIVVDNVFVSSEQIHQALHKEHEYMSSFDFVQIWSAVQPFAGRYLSNRDARSFNAILNFADEVWENKKRGMQDRESISYENYVPSHHEIRYFEEKEVRRVSTACPGKSGADVNDSPFSVSEFGNLESDKYGKRTFECPSCGKVNIRPENELLSNCQHCGSDVTCKETTSRKIAV